MGQQPGRLESKADQTIMGAGQGAETLSPAATCSRDVAKATSQCCPGVLSAPGESGHVGEGASLLNNGRLRDCESGWEWKGICLDPKDQQKSLEGIRLDVKKKALALRSTQTRDFQERQAGNCGPW